MKKVFALLSVAVVALALAMTGCGRNDENGGDTAPTTAPVTQAPGGPGNVVDDPGDGETPVQPGRNYEALRGTNIFVYHQGIGAHTMQDIADFEALHGVTIRIEDTPWAQYYARLMSLIMAGDPPDIFDSSDERLPMDALREIAQPIDGLYTPNAPFLDFGSMYGMRYMGNTYILAETGRVPILIFYNATMFNRFGQPTPMELYLAGEWTVQRMFDLASEFTYDIGGPNEQWGYASTSVYHLFGANQLPIVNYDSNAGQFSLAINGAQQLNVLQHALDAVTRQDIHPFGWHGPLFADGRLAMMGHESWFGDQLAGLEDDWSIAPFPVGQYGSADYAFIRPWGASVATGANNPMGGIAFIEFGFERNMTRGRTHVHFPWMNENRLAGIEAALGRNSFFSLHNGIPNFRPIADEVNNQMGNADGRSATDIVNEQLSAMQSYINDFNNLNPGWEEPRTYTDPGVLTFANGLEWMNGEVPETVTRTFGEDDQGPYMRVVFESGWVPFLRSNHEELVFVGGLGYVISFDYEIISLVDGEWQVFYTSYELGWTQYEFGGELTGPGNGRFVMSVTANMDHDEKEVLVRQNGIEEMIIRNFRIEQAEF